MLLSSLLGIIIGTSYFYYEKSTTDYCKKYYNNDIIDIYYPKEMSIKKLNLQYMDCPFTLNPCNNCEIKYISRKFYQEDKMWYAKRGINYNFPSKSDSKVYKNIHELENF